MAGTSQYRASDFLDAIPGSGGIKTTIAKRVGCAWHTVDKYVREYPTVAKAYADECEKVLDAAESVIVGDIVDRKEVQTAKWYLTMKGTERGYVQKQTHEQSGEVILKVVYDNPRDPSEDTTPEAA